MSERLTDDQVAWYAGTSRTAKWTADMAVHENIVTLAREVQAHRSRAVRLATMAVSGSDAPATCDTHSLTNRPDLWAQCEKVTVRDALMGRTCGAP